jgi:hypothetical protein
MIRRVTALPIAAGIRGDLEFAACRGTGIVASGLSAVEVKIEVDVESEELAVPAWTRK